MLTAKVSPGAMLGSIIAEGSTYTWGSVGGGGGGGCGAAIPTFTSIVLIKSIAIRDDQIWWIFFIFVVSSMVMCNRTGSR
jgi:hypothetical protein